MDLLLQGILIGLSLTIMVGPITLTIIDASLAGGWKAGLVSAVTMWISDLILVGLIYYGGQELMDRITVGNLESWVSFTAAGILIVIGIVIWILRNKKIDLTQSTPSAGHLIGHGLRGFLVNTFSPFTLLFWPSLIAARVLGTGMEHAEARVFLIGVVGAIATGDILKVFFANWIRQRISDRYMKFTRMGIAVLFVAGGLYMAYQGVSTI